MSESLLEVEGLRVRLATSRGSVTVVDGVDYTVQAGEVFGIAGESGSGKTLSMLALFGLLPRERSSTGVRCSAETICCGSRSTSSASSPGESSQWCSRTR